MKMISMVIDALALLLALSSCDRDDKPSDTYSIVVDSMTIGSHSLTYYEPTDVRVYAQGSNLHYQWEADHGTLLGGDSAHAVYYACFSCGGLNTVKCTITDDLGTAWDTVKVDVHE